MANGDLLSLGAWAPGRPVKTTEQNREQDCDSRTKRTRVHLRLLNQNAEALRDWAHKNKKDQQDLVDQLLVSYFRMDAQAPSDHDLIDHDDEGINKNLYKPSSSQSGSTGRPGAQILTAAQLAQLSPGERDTLTLYTELTGNKPKQQDLEAYAEHAEKPAHVVHSSMALVKLRRGDKRISSLRYLLTAVDEILDDGAAGPEYLQHLLRCLRRQPKQPALPTLGAEVKDFAQSSDH